MAAQGHESQVGGASVGRDRAVGGDVDAGPGRCVELGVEADRVAGAGVGAPQGASADRQPRPVGEDRDRAVLAVQGQGGAEGHGDAAGTGGLDDPGVIAVPGAGHGAAVDRAADVLDRRAVGDQPGRELTDRRDQGESDRKQRGQRQQDVPPG